MALGDLAERESGPSKPTRIALALAALMGSLGIGTLVISVSLWASQGFPHLPSSFSHGPLSVLPGALAAGCYVAVGWLLAARLPRSPIGWLLLVAGLGVATIVPVSMLVAQAQQAFRPAPPTTLISAWLLSSFGFPLSGALILIAGLLFPDGRLISPRWRIAVWLTGAGAAILATTVALDPRGVIWYPTLPNPVEVPYELAAPISVGEQLGGAMLIASALLLVHSLLRRYRAGDDSARAQVRWILYAGCLTAAFVTPLILARYVISVSDTAGEILVAFGAIGAASLPIAAAFAVTRYQLFGIDRLITRTLIFVPLMGILGGLYTAGLTLFQRLFVAMTGDTSDAAVVITLFLVAATITPVRRWLEGRMDRWTQRRPARGEAEPGSEELARTAAAVIALHRLESRVIADDAGRNPERSVGKPLPIDHAGQVSCPASRTVPFTACLGCGYMTALLTSPAGVLCRYRQPD